MTTAPSEHLRLRLRFSDCTVLVAERQLWVGGVQATVGARAFDVLLALLAHRHRLLTKNELLELVWPGRVVEENNLATQVSALRRLLGPGAIATIPGRGYRFAAAVVDEDAVAPAAAPSVPASPRLKTNMPAALPTLIGRAHDLEALGALVDRHRLVTVIGAGGVGKTRLAQAVLAGRDDGQRYAHGVCWVELAPVAGADALCGAVAGALGVEIGAGAPLPALVAAVAPLSLLLVLDNAEHLLEAVAATAEALLRAGPGVRIVVTSQAPLKVEDEHVYRLDALGVPPPGTPAGQAGTFGAVALFVERAQAAGARFTVDEHNAASLTDLCRALDGLPLALELAAARLPSLGLAGIAASLQERFRLLTRSRRGAPERQQTLMAALEWSHALLSGAERTVFRRMAVVAGSATLELVQGLVQGRVQGQAAGTGELDPWQALDALSGLVERSLVHVAGGVAVDEPPRYRLLDTPHAFAAAQLAQAGEKASAWARHAEWMAARCDAAYLQRWSGELGVDAWRQAFEPDLDNARAAFAWARSTSTASDALRIATTLIRALPRSAHDERTALADACVGLLTPAVAPAIQLRLWLAVCDVATGSRAQQMRDAAERALELARQGVDRFELYAALAHCAGSAARLGDEPGVHRALDEMRAVEDPSWPPQRRALGADAEYLGGRGDPARILQLTRAQMAVNRAAGGNYAIAMANLVDAELGAGEAVKAAETGQALVEHLRGTRDEHGRAYALINLTAAWLALGDAARARATAVEGWPGGRRFELQPLWADYLTLLAALEGRPRCAARLAGYADRGYERHEDKRQANEADACRRACSLARAVLGGDDFARLQVEGQALHDDAVAALAFAASDS